MQGQLNKMLTRLDQPVSYQLPVGDERLPMNDLLGKSFRLEYTGKITCIYCGRNTNKSFNQGYCYPCFQKLAQCDSCIMSPEKCHYDAGTCREPIWGEEHCMQDHIVYLANSSGLKVGITRASQIPTRWMDQGAVQGLPILRVRTRQQSGFVEAMIRQHTTDRTNWRAMLKGDTEPMDLTVERDRLLDECDKELKELQDRFGFHSISVLNGMEPVEISYPVQELPKSINSHNLDKDPILEGTLLGIKGQYLILDTAVINIRKYTAYEAIIKTP